MKTTNIIFIILFVIIAIYDSISEGTKLIFSFSYAFGVLFFPYLIVWGINRGKSKD
jgi:hypothetical protein